MPEPLVKAARAEGLNIKQSYEHVGRRLLMQSSRHAHARQMKRARACARKLKTQLGPVVREIERQVETPSNKLVELLATAHRIHAQQGHDKNNIYSVDGFDLNREESILDLSSRPLQSIRAFHQTTVFEKWLLPSLKGAVSPLGWEHINLTGDYTWRSNKRVAKGGFRSLRSPRNPSGGP